MTGRKLLHPQRQIGAEQRWGAVWPALYAGLTMALVGILLWGSVPVAQGATRSPILRPPMAGLTIGEAGARLAPYMPWLLGMDSPRTYMILVQNNHELRPTGGFIAAVGQVTVDRGKLQNIDFVDSYKVYSEASTYPAAPKPMQTHMGIALLVMRDANWSPDLPTTAQVARALFAQETATQVDGVITVDINAVKHLVGALGELEVEGAPAPITRDNIEETIIQFWERPAGSEATIEQGMNIPWFEQRKEFIPTIAKAALDRIQRGDVNLPLLFRSAQAALDERSIQMWVEQPEVQAVLAEARWDGGLHPESGSDYLAVVDTNMGYNKVDAALQRAAEYTVRWPEGPDQPALATLALTYTHPLDAVDEGCDQSPRYGTAYIDMVERCYFDYVRVLAPAGSRLLSVEGIAPDTGRARQGERGTEEMAGYFVMTPNAEQRLVFTYRLPAGITPANYRLLVQRQAGTAPLPLTLDIDGERSTQTMATGWLEWGRSVP